MSGFEVDLHLLQSNASHDTVQYKINSANETDISTVKILTQSADKGIDYKFIIIPLAALLVVAVFTLIVIMALRRSKINKLRHHLMPLYNFDPAEECEGDWENELLEEDKEQQVALNYNVNCPIGGPQLKFHPTDHMMSLM